ncbi:glycosyltransferase [Marinisporobacter balticus]|uniref:Glycosyltransferase involved in cell wall biosynthesis n=1 Tax=Marinisporobacter balticus TaxID=2018667 RepID=A0A4V2SCE8_9FIRM|nr:glycosyltransferase [Marinisporobacter balticus]TCO79060.1 glycosyltransferase involved in cell wall biosynthesis [Marinisporobacter balticus]
MDVLFQIRKDYLSNVAGDSIIVQNLRKQLIDLGVKVDIHTDERINLSKYDIVHIFNTIRVQESYQFMKHALSNHKKIVLTPIYWDLQNYLSETKQTEKLVYWHYSEKKRKFLFDHCDIYLPHCIGEAELIIRNYHNYVKYEVIPYGVDERFSMGTKHYLMDQYGIDNYILCVGRINEQKNQLGLIRALSNEKIPLVLVGSVNDKQYLKKCMKEVNGNILLLDNVKTSQLNSLYKSAKVHVLPSWIEYPGLANLEAGMAGCNVVTTEIGSTKDVFGEFVRYCNPYDEQSIYKQTMEAFETATNNIFRDYIMENYTWLKSAKKVKDIYLLLTEQKR